MSLIQIDHLTFAYDGSYDDIFTDVSFQLDTDWKLGLTGRNGRGKTTLLRLLTGELHGQGRITAGVTFDYFPYPVADPQLPVQQAAESLAPGCPPWQLLREFGRLGLEEDVFYRPLCTLSQGEQTKALLAALFAQPGHFLLIDEPTNHLDAAGRALVSRYLNSKKGFILVSHDRDFLDGCVDHMLALNRCDIEVQQGNFTTWQHNRMLADQYELARNRQLRRDIGRLDAAARRTGAWADKVEAGKKGLDPVARGGPRADRGYIGHQAAKMMKRACAIQQRTEAAMEEKRGLLKNLEENEPLKLSPLAHHKPVLARLQDVSAWYGRVCACRGVSLEVRGGQRVALQGPNGCGKSTLLKLVCGQDIRHTGMVELAPGLIVSYVSQDTGFLQGSPAAWARECGLPAPLFLAILRKFGFDRVQFEKDMAAYSQGQKKKVLLARSLCQQAHLYVWDEPLNYVDVLSRIQLEELLLAARPTLLFVEHDQAFTRRVATHSIQLG